MSAYIRAFAEKVYRDIGNATFSTDSWFIETKRQWWVSCDATQLKKSFAISLPPGVEAKDVVPKIVAELKQLQGC